MKNGADSAPRNQAEGLIRLTTTPWRTSLSEGIKGVGGRVELLVGHAPAVEFRKQRGEPLRVLVEDADRSAHPAIDTNTR